jgi:PhnB protein
MASDTPPGHAPSAKGGFAISLGYEKAQDARRIFDALSQGGTVTMPMQKTFWAETFGMLTDRFGTTWFVGGAPQAA